MNVAANISRSLDFKGPARGSDKDVTEREVAAKAVRKPQTILNFILRRG